MSNFTLEDLVQYLYKETSELKIAAIKAALKTDWKLREAFNQLKSGQTQPLNPGQNSESVTSP